MSPPRVAVVIPTYNEAENVPRLIPALSALGLDLGIWVMDDGSTDGTLEVLDQLAATHPGLRVRRRSGPRGYGLASAEGLHLAAEAGFDIAIQMDADLSHDPCYLPAMIEAAGQADLVLGSRYLNGVSVVNWPLSRLLLSSAANAYVRCLAGLEVHDCTTGFRAWRASLLGKLPLLGLRSNGYSFLVETLFLARQAGARVTEVPIIFVERRAGASKLSGAVFVESALLPIRLFACRVLRAID